MSLTEFIANLDITNDIKILKGLAQTSSSRGLSIGIVDVLSVEFCVLSSTKLIKVFNERRKMTGQGL